MKKSLLFLIVSFIFLGCGTSSNEDVTFKSVFPNNTWYYDNIATNTYNEWKVRGLNENINWNNYGYPCNSSDSSRFETTIDYEIQNESTFIFQPSGGSQDTGFVTSVSLDEIIIELDDRILELKRNCEDITVNE